jgi:hypothetical protein
MKIKLIAISLLVLTACKKEFTKPEHIVLQSQQSRVAAVTKEVAEILQQVYTDQKAYMEVNAAIFRGHYCDERILLKDLLKVDTSRFKHKFCEILEKGNYPIVTSELASVLKLKKGLNTAGNMVLAEDSTASVLSTVNPIAIYFPYSENFINGYTYDTVLPDNQIANLVKPTIVYSDREADTGPGKKPVFCTTSPNKLCYVDVLVNDQYAEVFPTHIVTVGAIVRTDVPAVLKTELVTRTYHGWSRLTQQMDKLISFTGNGGGSEIKVCRINGFLKMSDEQITNFAGDVITLQYTRADIRKKRWKRVFGVWDPNWNYQDIEQVYAVYEDDTKGTRTITGSLKTTVNLPGKTGKTEGDLGFRIELTSQDEVITQRKFDRKSFLRDGMNNQGYGFIADANDFLPTGKDWPVIDGGAIWSYTFPYRIY